MKDERTSLLTDHPSDTRSVKHGLGWRGTERLPSGSQGALGQQLSLLERRDDF